MGTTGTVTTFAPGSFLSRWIPPQYIKRIEIFFLSFAGAMLVTPSGKAYVAGHPFIADIIGCLYIAWRAADNPNPTFPAWPGSKGQ